MNIEAIKNELRSEINALLEMIPDEEIESILEYKHIERILHAARKLGRIEGIKIIEDTGTPNVSELRELMNRLNAEIAVLKHVHEEYKNKYSKESQLKAILIEAQIQGLEIAIKIIDQLKPL